MIEQTYTLTLTAEDLDRTIRALDRHTDAMAGTIYPDRLADEARTVRALRVRLAEIRSADALQCREAGEHIATTRHARAACPLGE